MFQFASPDEALAAEPLVRRARELVPVLAARAEETERLRRVPDQTILDFQEAGFFGMLQPARWGGLEVDPAVFFEVQMTVARACPSSAWVLGVMGVHGWQLALFPDLAQEEVWGQDRRTLVSSSYAPTGRIERAPGGFRVRGRWSFSSGCDHAGWVFLGGFVPVGPDEKPDMRTFLLPRADWRIDDNWHVVGLKGTGSKDVVVEDAFVPEHRTHRLIDGFKCRSPGQEKNQAPLYRLPFGQVFVRSVSTSAIGAAMGALDLYKGVTKARVAAADQARVAEEPLAQTVCAEAAAAIDEIRTILFRNFAEMMAHAKAGTPIPVERRVRFRYDSSRAVEKCVGAVDALFTASGGRALFTSNPLQRFFLDVHAARAHYANNPDKPGRNLGRVELEQKNQDFFI